MKKGDLVCSKELPCLGIGVVEYIDDEPHNSLTIVTVRFEHDEHGHLPEDHAPREDWDYNDLVIASPCTKGCANGDELTHTSEQHSEDWVNLSDARYTGEVIFMPANLIYWAVEIALSQKPTLNEYVSVHVDRRVVQSLVDALRELDPYGDPSVGIFEDHNAIGVLEELLKQLDLHPVRESSE